LAKAGMIGASAIEQWAEEHQDAFKPPMCNKVAGARRPPASRGCAACFLRQYLLWKKSGVEA